MKIFKYPLPLEQNQQIRLPWSAEILDVQMQDAKAVLWAIVDPDDDRTRMRHIEMLTTGQPFEPRHRKYISTLQIHGAVATLVLHWFEVI